MRHLTIQDYYDQLFAIALEAYQEKTPPYETNQEGVKKLEGVLHQVEHGYYTNVFEKAAYLFFAINKGHFFVNGNKRLALMSALAFLVDNGYHFLPHPVIDYRNWFGKALPWYEFQETPEKFEQSHGWALLELSIAIASSHESAEHGKQILKDFLEQFTYLKLHS